MYLVNLRERKKRVMTREERKIELEKEIKEISRLIKNLRKQRHEKKVELKKLLDELNFIASTQKQKESVPGVILRREKDVTKSRAPGFTM